MKIINSYSEFKNHRSEIEAKVAFVPTMGALHQGHLSLIRKANEYAGVVVVSIFVNPLQFGPNEDLAKYPNTFDEDLKALEKLGVDYLFAPGSNNAEWNYYLNDPSIKTEANPELANCLCGLSRPGHFDGVCTVVNLLFDTIKPNYAVFGTKDYQQLMIIRDMVERLDMDIEIIAGNTFRETSGLAMSSRNKYLNEAEKKIAPEIFLELNKVGYDGFDLDEAKQRLEEKGIQVEYFESKWDRLLFAGRLGSTRLIDNIPLPIKGR